MPIVMWYYPNLDNEYDRAAVNVYDISYDSNGYPLFLFYYNGQWIRKSAKYFKPISES